MAYTTMMGFSSAGSCGFVAALMIPRLWFYPARFMLDLRANHALVLQQRLKIVWVRKALSSL